METYDILMLIVLAGATLFGAIKGFAWQLASIGSIIVSYLVAYHFREPFSESIQADPPWNRFLAMLILYVGTSLVIWMVFRMVSRTIDRMRLKEFDRQIGAIFGLAKGALYCTLITLFAVTLLGERTRDRIVGSRSGHYIAKVLDKSQSVIPPELHEVVQPVLDKFDARFSGEGGYEQDQNGFLPSWNNASPNAIPGIPTGDGNSISEAIWNRFSNDQNSSRTESPDSRRWPSGPSSTPLESEIQNGFRSLQNSVDQFGRTIDQGQQQVQQGLQDGRRTIDQGRQAIQQFQPRYDQFREGVNQIRQSYARPESPASNGLYPQNTQPPAGNPIPPWQR
ncbi:MAG: CvpA family protein [Planctomycetota bacterium]